MKLHSVEAIAIDIPLKQNFGGSTYSVLKRSTVITRLRTKDGVTSNVYNGDNRAHAGEIARLVAEVLFPLAKGMSIFEYERIWEKMFALTTAQGDRKVLMEAISCMDCAIWDLIGKSLNKSVRELLGGYRETLPIISIGGYYMPGKKLADFGTEIESYKKAGMAGCKFKVGGLTPEEDANRVEIARKAVGKDFMICVDANRGWNAQDAIRFARLIEHLDIAWFEEPCLWHDDAAMMTRVRKAIRIPTTAGQSEITTQGVRRLLDAGAVDYVNYDVSEGGGVTDWRRAAALCAAAGVQMAHHEEAQISSQLLSAVPHGTYAECFAHPDRDPMWQHVWVNRPQAKNGMIEVLKKPGFGIKLDEKIIRKYRVN